MLRECSSGLDTVMKNNILTAQYTKQKLARLGLLSIQNITSTIREFFPQLNQDAVKYMNTELTISLAGETIYQIMIFCN
jgi:hypothetical protein